MKIKCPKCHHQIEVNPAAMLGSIKSPAKKAAAQANAKKGGWPKGRKRGPRKPKPSA